MARNESTSDYIRKNIERAARRARKVGGRVAQAVAETPEFISLQRNDRALRSEMSECFERIGKRALLLHKRSKGKALFNRYSAVQKDLEKLERLEEEYRDNKSRLAELKRQLRKGR